MEPAKEGEGMGGRYASIVPEYRDESTLRRCACILEAMTTSVGTNATTPTTSATSQSRASLRCTFEQLTEVEMETALGALTPDERPVEWAHGAI
jgi:hypothetical protein